MLVDERTRLRLGKLVGAKLMVFGGVDRFAGNTMNVNLRLVEVDTGLVLKSVGKYYDIVTYDLSEWLKAFEEMTPELFIICQ